MPKAQRRTSGARAAPYPAIKPGDTPASSSTKKSATKQSSTANTKSDATPSKTAKKALADKSSSETNVAPKRKSASKTKKADSGPTPASKPSEEEIAPTDTSSNEVPPTTKKPSGLTDEEFALKQSASNFLEITLPGESDSTIPMHDTCSTLRHKINDLLGKNNTKPENGNPAEKKKDGSLKPFTKASFVRAIGCSNKTLETFLGAKKIMGGAESAVYPAAYCFFEKKRIWEGKKKTAARLKVEEDRPNGLAFRDPNHIRIKCKRGTNPAKFLDEYGQ